MDGEMKDLSLTARVAATSDLHWRRLFEHLRAALPAVDRICAALQVDAYTAYLARVAQPADLEPILGGAGLFADREHSRTFEVIAAGAPYLVKDEDWAQHPDLAVYGVVMKSNLKFSVSFGGYPTVWNVWSRQRDAFSERRLVDLAEVAAELSR